MTLDFEDLFDVHGDSYEAKESIRFGKEPIQAGRRFGADSLICGIPIHELQGRSYEVEIVYGVYIVKGLAYKQPA